MKVKRKVVENKLFSIGITPNLVGFDYICMAVELISENSRLRMSDIYLAVANEYSATYTSVERAIRHSISKITDSGFKELGFAFKTNSEFLYSLALKLKNEEEEDELN